MKVALYARVSTEDKGQDPEAQLSILRELAGRRGYEIYKEYVDHASGKDANRPAWKRLMKDASRHEFDAVFALRLDRVMRSVINLENVIQELEGYRVALVFSDQSIDMTSPNGRLQYRLIAAIAEWEREIISLRTKEGMAEKKRKGSKFGRHTRKDVPIEEIRRMRADGWGWKRIAKETGIPKTTILDRRDEIEGSERGGASAL